MEAEPYGLSAAIFSSPEDPDTLNISEYNGGNIEFYYQMSASLGDQDVEYAVGFMINGVYQDIKIERNGTVSDYAQRHIVRIPAGTSQIYKIMLRPNIGKAGETVKFCNCTIVNPNDRVTKDNDWYRPTSLDWITTVPIKIKMNVVIM